MVLKWILLDNERGSFTGKINHRVGCPENLVFGTERTVRMFKGIDIEKK